MKRRGFFRLLGAGAIACGMPALALDSLAVSDGMVFVREEVVPDPDREGMLLVRQLWLTGDRGIFAFGLTSAWAWSNSDMRAMVRDDLRRGARLYFNRNTVIEA